MAVRSWKGTLQISLINIPVRIIKGVDEEGISFNLMHKNCGGAIGYHRETYCKLEDACNSPDDDLENTENIGKGWNGHAVDLDYIKQLKQSKSDIIQLGSFVPASQIDPRYYKESYDVTPEEVGTMAYALMAKALEVEGLVAVGTSIFRDMEQIVSVRPRDGVLSLELMYWPDDLTRAGRDATARQRVASVEVTKEQLELARTLITSMRGDFDPSKFKPVTKTQILSYLNGLGTGETPPTPVQAKPQAAPNDLMAVLRASVDKKVEETKAAKPAKAKTSKKKEPVPAK